MLKEKIKEVSKRLSNPLGYVIPGRKKLVNDAVKKYGKIDLNAVANYISRKLAKDKIVRILSNEESSMRCVYLASNSVTPPDMVIAQEFSLKDEDAKRIFEFLKKENYNVKNALRRAKCIRLPSVTSSGTKIDKTIIDFAKLHLMHRLNQTSLYIIKNKGLLRATCKQIAQLSDSSIPIDVKDQRALNVMNYISQEENIRKRHKQMPYYNARMVLGLECAKMLFYEGMMPYDNFDASAIESLSLAIAWSKINKKAKESAIEAARGLFELSCVHHKPESVAINFVDRFSGHLDNIVECGIPCATAVEFEFLDIDNNHTRDYLKNILGRISKSCGRNRYGQRAKRKKNAASKIEGACVTSPKGG